MPLPLFYLPDLDLHTDEFVLNEETSKHVIQVLRMKIGESLKFTDGKGSVITASISHEHKKAAKAKVDHVEKTPPSAYQTTIAISPVKNTSRFEWFLEKATEIGINKIIPLICKRTEKQHLKTERMKSIAISAMLQSQQSWLPEITEAIKFETLLSEPVYQKKYIAHCIDGKKQHVKNDSPADKTIILIGPEGDFTEEEVSMALENNYVAVTLGETRLRTETAGLVAAVLLRNLEHG